MLPHRMRPMQSVRAPTEMKKKRSMEDSGKRIWMREVYAKGKLNLRRTCSEECAGRKMNSKTCLTKPKDQEKSSKKSRNSKKLLMMMSKNMKRNK